MGHTSSNNEANNATKARNVEEGDEVKPPKISNSKGGVFHDFLGKGCSATSETFFDPKVGNFTSGGVSKQLQSEASPPVSASIGGTFAGCAGGLVPISATADMGIGKLTSGGVSKQLQSEASPPVSASIGGTFAGCAGGLVPLSATADMGIEKHGGSHFEGLPFYGPRGVCTGPGLVSRMSGTKRSNSDSFLGSSREMLSSARPELLEGSHLTKLLRHVGREQRRRPHDDTSLGLQQLRPISASQISQHSTGDKTDATASNWNHAAPVNISPVLQYPPRAGQATRFGYLTSQTKSRDASAGPSVVSQAAADEGSRTRKKGSGIWSSIERNISGGLASGTQESGTHISEPEFLYAPSGHVLDSSNRQMTIFFGGQAHVFDHVHPNKADVIMSLAGSNGGSWSTTYAPTLDPRPSSGENHTRDTDSNVTRTINGYALARESLGRSLVHEHSMRLPGSSHKIPNSTGIHQVITLSKETKGSNQATNTRSKEERHDL